MSATPSLTARLKQHALELGFDAAGVTQAAEPLRLDKFHDWLDAGYAGQMRYLADRREAYRHPRHVLDGVRGVVMLATIYAGAAPSDAAPGQGRVSRYAWGLDYHDVMHERLRKLAAWLAAEAPAARVRGVVDTAPLFERELAQQAGLGWIGKHTLLLSRELGSWFFLAALLTDLPLEADEPFAADHCGTCRACLDACPTQAFVAPYVLDSRRCISYLTIELREQVPAELRPGLGDWVFGCDVCQEVCPWNRQAPAREAPEFAPAPGSNPLALAALFDLTDDEFRARFRDTPLWRAKRRGLLRNAALVLGNQRDAKSLPALIRGLHDAEPLVRAAAAWALGRLRDPSAMAALTARLAEETDAAARQEIEQAVGRGSL